jgi:pyruvate,orthophosphate dikinase
MNKKDLYGNKGHNLMIMFELGLPVPTFHILDTEFLHKFFSMPLSVQYSEIDNLMRTTFDSIDFISVRSSPNYSLPGILDTELNVSTKDISKIIGLIHANNDSLFSPKVGIYKKQEKIVNELQSAVILQKMVFGNKNENSGSGVCFSSSPITGRAVLYGEFLMNTQGEKLVDGSTTPLEIEELKKLKPKVFSELDSFCAFLEKNFKEIQDIEFTFEDDKLYILQTRNAKTTTQANLTFRSCLLEAGVITQSEFETMTEKPNLNQNMLSKFNKDDFKLVGKGIGASSGILLGVLAFNKEQLSTEKSSIYAANLTSTDDIDIISKSAGILTLNGGKTSHAAIVSRSWGKVCVVGCSDITISSINELIFKNGEIAKAGDEILIDGDTGEIFIKK